ncbi:MAG: hypothetical protein EOP47_05580 [Sphingobacteriaceae bacterium]|nr:MAG: hypothetical protein EOP47_05580 [Sphingobacteriaceae bacterium]
MTTVNKKKVFFIASRFGCLEELLKHNSFEIIELWVLQDSALHSRLINESVPYQLFNLGDKKKILSRIAESNFDILFSNGCPFILPVSSIKKPHQLFINTHPTMLPYLKGKTGINGVLYHKMKYFGATTHFMDDGIDTGKIIAQKKAKVSPDLDIGLVYFISFQLEKDCFTHALNLLVKTNYQIRGKKQVGEGSYFNRTEDLLTIDITKHTTEEILLKIQSFGLQTQGAKCQIDNKTYLIFDAEKISNNYLLDNFLSAKPGEILLQYDAKFLLKTLNGIIKVKNYKTL